MKKIISIVVVFMFLVSVGIVSAGEYKGRKIDAKFATIEYEKDFQTVWAKRFAKEMKKWSDGKIDITVYIVGELGDNRDINELCQIGVLDFAFTDYAWLSSFVPQVAGLALHYIWPRERFKEVLLWVMKNGKFMGLLEEKSRYNGLVLLGIYNEGWQWITSNKPINSIDDMDGFKLRLMSSKMLVESYKAYGVAPTPMTWSEVYMGLQTGLIEGQANPMSFCYNSKIYEVQKYFTQIYAEPFFAIPIVNMKFFDSLPKNAQAKIRQFWEDAVVPSAEYSLEKNKEDKVPIMEARPEIKFTELSDEKLAPFKEKAKSVQPKYIKLGGKDAKEILEVLLKDIADAKKALGIE